MASFSEQWEMVGSYAERVAISWGDSTIEIVIQMLCHANTHPRHGLHIMYLDTLQLESIAGLNAVEQGVLVELVCIQ